LEDPKDWGSGSIPLLGRRCKHEVVSLLDECLCGRRSLLANSLDRGQGDERGQCGHLVGVGAVDGWFGWARISYGSDKRYYVNYRPLINLMIS
jgi:hypothetical protein